jgi:hypothetical protein
VSPEQRRYLLVQGCLGAALVNALLNGAIGWAITTGLAEFPVWKLPGVAGDLVATAFGVSFGTCLAAKFTVRWDVARKKITTPVLSPALSSLLARMPERTLPRSLWLGIVSIPVFGVPAVAALFGLGIASLDRVPFVALKAAFSAVEAALVTPLIVLAVLSDVSGEPELK